MDPDGRCVEAKINADIQGITAPIGYIGDTYGISSLSNFRDNANYMANMALYQAPNIAFCVNALAGIPLGIADLNIFGSSHSTSANGVSNFGANGIATSDDDVKAMSQLISSSLNISQNNERSLANPSHGIAFDLIRAFGQWTGATDITSLRAADMLNTSGPGNINIVAFSNGTELIAGAMPYIDPSVRARINFQGFGGQRYIDQNTYGLKSAINKVIPADPVPLLTPGNWGQPYSVISGSPFQWNHPFQAHDFKSNYAPYIIPAQ